MAEFINVGGHSVPADRVDMFFDAETGAPISDAEWDEQKRRIEAGNSSLIPEEFR